MSGLVQRRSTNLCSPVESWYRNRTLAPEFADKSNRSQTYLGRKPDTTSPAVCMIRIQLAGRLRYHICTGKKRPYARRYGRNTDSARHESLARPNQTSFKTALRRYRLLLFLFGHQLLPRPCRRGIPQTVSREYGIVSQLTCLV